MPEETDSSCSMTLIPIGHVKNDINVPMRDEWEGVVSEIVLRDDLAEATEGLDQFSHIVVVFWMHRVPQGEDLPSKVHPRRRPDLPLVGLFATRAPHRPNPIGISVVKLIEVRQNTLKVRGLDAINGTPVVDIKPYLPRKDDDVSLPRWAKKL